MSDPRPARAFRDGILGLRAGSGKVLPGMMGKGEKAPAKPWDGAEGLEWEVPSPAPFHTFETPPKLNAEANKIVA